MLCTSVEAFDLSFLVFAICLLVSGQERVCEIVPNVLAL